MSAEEHVDLSNGVSMPVIGYGTFPIPDRDAEKMVAAAIAAGYRLIDTAEIYRNEEGVGRGLRASGVERADLFVTTKLSQRWHGYQEAQEAFAISCKRLGLDYLDLFLIHWPNPRLGRFVDAWRGMIELLKQERVRAIGVSNFKPSHLQRLIDETEVVPHVNQIELNPWLSREAEREYHSQHGIVTESWAPIGQGGGLLGDPVIAEMARARGQNAGTGRASMASPARFDPDTQDRSTRAPRTEPGRIRLLAQRRRDAGPVDPGHRRTGCGRFRHDRALRSEQTGVASQGLPVPG